MARHSHWANIKRGKSVEDNKRGKTFTKHAKLIELAVRRGGGDPDMNPTLRSAIDSAREDNVPRENIERAIKKGTGEIKGSAIIEEKIYEGFGPGNVAMLVHALTDNTNRAVANIRATFSKSGGRLGESNSVSWMFEKKGLIQLELTKNTNAEEIELAAIDADAEDMECLEESVLVFTAPEKLASVKNQLEKAGYKSTKAEISFIPKDSVQLNDQESIEKLKSLIEKLEADEDVNEIIHNGVW